MTFSVRDQCANVVGDRKGKGTVIDFGSDGRDVVAMGAELILEKLSIGLLQGGVLLFV